MSYNTCASCAKDRNEEDLVWVDLDGKANMSGRPYCVSCAPEENYEGDM